MIRHASSHIPLAESDSKGETPVHKITIIREPSGIKKEESKFKNQDINLEQIECSNKALNAQTEKNRYSLNVPEQDDTENLKRILSKSPQVGYTGQNEKETSQIDDVARRKRTRMQSQMPDKSKDFMLLALLMPINIDTIENKLMPNLKRRLFTQNPKKKKEKIVRGVRKSLLSMI